MSKRRVVLLIMLAVLSGCTPHYKYQDSVPVAQFKLVQITLHIVLILGFFLAIVSLILRQN